MKTSTSASEATPWQLKILIAICILIPIYIGGDSAYARYQTSKQTQCVIQHWLPANAEVFTNSKEWLSKLGDTKTYGLVPIPTFNQYKDQLADQKHYVLFQGTSVKYATISGKVVLTFTDYHDGTPASTDVQATKYLGDGKMSFELEREWGSLVIVPILKAIFWGTSIDAIVCIIALIAWRVWDMVQDVKRKRKEKKNELKDSGLRTTHPL